MTEPTATQAITVLASIPMALILGALLGILLGTMLEASLVPTKRQDP